MTSLVKGEGKKRWNAELVPSTTNISYAQSTSFALERAYYILYHTIFPKHFFYHASHLLLKCYSSSSFPFSPKFQWLLLFHWPPVSTPISNLTLSYFSSYVSESSSIHGGPSAKVRHLAWYNLASRPSLINHESQCPFARILSFFLTTQDSEFLLHLINGIHHSP